MSNVKCSECKAVMRRPDWDVHDCPAIPKPKKGESFESYKTRCEAAKRMTKTTKD
jgi:hypothetical protein